MAATVLGSLVLCLVVDGVESVPFAVESLLLLLLLVVVVTTMFGSVFMSSCRLTKKEGKTPRPGGSMTDVGVLDGVAKVALEDAIMALRALRRLRLLEVVLRIRRRSSSYCSSITKDTLFCLSSDVDTEASVAEEDDNKNDDDDLCAAKC